MKKFIITLTLTDLDAERISEVWDKADLPEVIKKAMEEFCIERYDAEQYVFKKWGIGIMVNDDWKNKVLVVKDQCQAAKLLQKAEIEEEIQEEET